jgi:hypothetical protein
MRMPRLAEVPMTWCMGRPYRLRNMLPNTPPPTPIRLENRPVTIPAPQIAGTDGVSPASRQFIRLHSIRMPIKAVRIEKMSFKAVWLASAATKDPATTPRIVGALQVLTMRSSTLPRRRWLR